MFDVYVVRDLGGVVGIEWYKLDCRKFNLSVFILFLLCFLFWLYKIEIFFIK